MRLRLASWNIHRAIGGDGRASPQRCAEVLKELDADLVALQEVESRPGHPFDLLQFLADESGLLSIPGMTMIREDSHYGNALLTRWLPEIVRLHDLSVHPREPRGVIDVVMEHEGRRMQLLASHLGLRPAERRQQVRRLLGLIGEYPLVVLAGDWNEWLPWGRPLRSIRRRFPRSPARRSWPAWVPVFALDRIWVQPSEALLRLDTLRTPLTRAASDHLPLVAEIEW